MFPIGATGVNQAGFSQSSSVVASLDSFLTPNATLANPFPDGIQRPTGSSLGLATFLGKDVTFFNTNVLNPYSMRWELSVQRELPGATVLEVAYIGNHAVHLGLGSTARDHRRLPIELRARPISKHLPYSRQQHYQPADSLSYKILLPA